MSETLQQDDCKNQPQEDVLNGKMGFIHVLESEIDEWVEIGNAKRSSGKDEKHQTDGEHRPGKPLGIRICENLVLELLPSLEQCEE